MKQPPCHNCPNRHELCHMDCEGYRLFQEEHKRINSIRQMANKTQEYFTTATIKTIKQATNRR